MRKVVVIDYDEQWVQKFREEAIKISEIFGEELIDIHHIGSTSVEGLKSKPIIDIMPVVLDINLVDRFNQAMAGIGYVAKGENGIPNRRYFQKGGDNRTHHVHIYEIDNPEIDRHLAFREYLRAHSEIAHKYGNLKESLAKLFPFDIESYIKGKEQLALEIERKALDWYRINNRMESRHERRDLY